MKPSPLSPELRHHGATGGEGVGPAIVAGDLHRGFTLLEVLIALAISALGMIAVFGVVAQSAYDASYLRESTLANWVAMNVATQLRLADTKPEVGETDGAAELAGMEWEWEATISETGVENLFRADITVTRADDPETTLATLAAFLGLPVPRQGTTDWYNAVSGAPRHGNNQTQPLGRRVRDQSGREQE